jgi:membrane protein YdbS with pleckstrin-like domain
MEFYPSPRLRMLYSLCLIIVVWAGVVPCMIVLSLISPPEFVLAVAVAAMAVLIAVSQWIRAYVASIRYVLDNDVLIFESGVWLHRSGRILFSDIQGVSIRPGTGSKLSGTFTLVLHLKGQKRSEFVIRGLTEPERIRDVIAGYLS